ncbi:hypothetical protein LTR17_023816 [Elasticomyces elasticus]|nr:hypothetical protein LTR17_023816 [Elasticomyces elasticus]
MSWPRIIYPDDYDRVMQAYHEALGSQQLLRIEFRALGEENPWRLLLLTPLGDDKLQHVSLREYGGSICSIVDITSEKSVELAERRAAKEAWERKEQQERFIDMISHKIRNPVSAVLHCSEDIEEAVTDKTNIDSAAIMEAVETINLCISHQGRLLDDVLCFSKLDASMLTLTPKPCQTQPAISQLDGDVSVLINLVSSGIKFTARGDGEKKLVISLGATKQRPTSFPPNVVIFNPDDSASHVDATNSADWGGGEPVYIMVVVKDTGIGITDEGQK